MIYLSIIPFALGALAYIYITYVVNSRRDINMRENNFTVGRMPAIMLIILPFGFFIYGGVMLALYFIIGDEAAELDLMLIVLSAMSGIILVGFLLFTHWRLVIENDTMTFKYIFMSKTCKFSELKIEPAVTSAGPVNSDKPSYNISFGKSMFTVFSNQQGYNYFIKKLEKQASPAASGEQASTPDN